MEYSKLRSGDKTYIQHRESATFNGGHFSCCRTYYFSLCRAAKKAVGFTRDGMLGHARKL
jgi:hypothetical protein